MALTLLSVCFADAALPDYPDYYNSPFEGIAIFVGIAALIVFIITALAFTIIGIVQIVKSKKLEEPKKKNTKILGICLLVFGIIGDVVSFGILALFLLYIILDI